MNVFISQPYCGALYWWFNTQTHTSEDLKSRRPRHEYYRRIYGDVDRHFDVALTLLVVFDEVTLPSADTAFPETPGLSGTGKYESGGLSLRMDWEPTLEARHLLEAGGSDLAEELSAAGFDTGSWEAQQEVESAASDLIAAHHTDATILAGPGRQQTLEALLDSSLASALIGSSAGSRPDAVVAAQEYVALTGLRYESIDYEALGRLRLTESIRNYASGFREQLAGEPVDLRERIAVAMVKADSAADISGSFEALSKSLDIASYVPVIGQPAAWASKAAEGAEALAGRAEQKHRWYELAPKIEEQLSRDQLRRSLEDDGYI